MSTKIRYGSVKEYSKLLLTSKNEKKAKQKKHYDTYRRLSERGNEHPPSGQTDKGAQKTFGRTETYSYP